MAFLERDLYEPVKTLLEQMGFFVQAEVKGCDVLAQKEDTLLAVELKKGFQLKLIYQAMERQSYVPFVYVAVPRPKKSGRDKEFRQMMKLLERLGIGLIFVSMEVERPYAQLVLEAAENGVVTNSRKKRAAKEELAKRSGSFNTGGVTKTKLITAYREAALAVLLFASQREQVTPKELEEAGFDKKAASILARNYYGWFEKKARGVYGVTPEGQAALQSPQYAGFLDIWKQRQKEQQEERQEKR